MKRPTLSIVVPCFNEETCLPELYRRASEAAHSVAGDDYELVLVNDGSTDGSWALLVGLADGDPHLLAINLSRNHGHQLALTAGLELCSGEYILLLDADLQDPPELLPAMMAEMTRHRADVVFGVRLARPGESLFKRASARLFYRLFKRFVDIDLPLDSGDFRLLTRRALDALLNLPERARFVRGMVAWVGLRQVPFAYDREQRLAGTTKYSFTKIIRLAIDAITGFSTAPLRIASHFGLLLSAGSVLLFAYILIRWWSGETVPGWASLMTIVTALGAANMLVLGIIGQYLGRLVMESKHRPLYIISEVAGRDPPAPALGYYARPSGSDRQSKPRQ